jgi:hypothetical protein
MCSKTAAIATKVRELVEEHDARKLAPPKIVCFTFNERVIAAVDFECRELSIEIACLVATESKRLQPKLKAFREHVGASILIMKTSQFNAGVDIPEAQ